MSSTRCRTLRKSTACRGMTRRKVTSRDASGTCGSASRFELSKSIDELRTDDVHGGVLLPVEEPGYGDVVCILIERHGIAEQVRVAEVQQHRRRNLPTGADRDPGSIAVGQAWR